MFDFIHGLAMIPLILVIVASLGIILKGADFFVEGASSISIKLGMSAFVVGLTIVAIGTSAPELFINAIAAYSGATDLSIGNILGSNVAGLLLGLGIAALFIPLKLKSGTVWKEIPFSLLGAILVLIFGIDIIIDGGAENIVTRSEGLTLLAFFVIFIVYTFGLNQADDSEESDDEIVEYSWVKSLVYIAGGVLGLIVGGALVVESAVTIASMAGLSQNLIGLTIVAIGTSLPEIVTAVVAAKKGQVDMVVGGIIGTIIFNIFFALGITAVIAPLPFSTDNITDALFLMTVSVIFFIFMFVGAKHKLEKWQGIFFIVMYISYIIFAVMREISL